jgi:large subunit ribosomal protein L36e
MELIKNSKDKRAKKLCKKRVSFYHVDSLYRHLFLTVPPFKQLGTFVRAKAKVEELTNVIAESRRH